MSNIERLLKYLPYQIGEEIHRISVSRGVGLLGISEIRMRLLGRNSIIILGERVALASLIGTEDINRTFSLICEGAVYAHREAIKEGYISLFDGIRVGICGHARYECGELVGISNVTALVFRIPIDMNFDISPLYEAWEGCSKGMLIYSPPGVGKTTALRKLAVMIGSGKCAEQVAVIDERCEFIPENYRNMSVDLLRGYKRANGMEIALRTLSPTVIMVDEIGKMKEAGAMLESLNSGVRIIATAHAKSYDDLKKRVTLRPFFENEIFDIYVGITVENGARRFVFEENES